MRETTTHTVELACVKLGPEQTVLLLLQATDGERYVAHTTIRGALQLATDLHAAVGARADGRPLRFGDVGRRFEIDDAIALQLVVALCKAIDRWSLDVLGAVDETRARVHELLTAANDATCDCPRCSGDEGQVQS